MTEHHREVMQKALEALEADDSKLWPSDKRIAAITALKAALAEPVPVQEPVAWRYKYADGFWRFSNGERVNGCDPVESQPLYTAPPQRKPLTDEEILNIFADVLQTGTFFDVARAIERAHGIGK